MVTRMCASKISVLGAVCLAVQGIVQAQTQRVEVLSLHDCYAAALDRSEAVGISDAEWRAAEERYRQARDTFVPSITLSGEATFKNREADSKRGDSYSGFVRADQTLYSGFRITRTAEARKAEGRAIKFDSERLRQLLYMDVSDVFHQVILCERDVQILDDLSSALKQTAAELDRRVELGRARKADVLSAKTDLAELAVDRESVAGNLAAARELMSFMLGRDHRNWRLSADSFSPGKIDAGRMFARAVSRPDIRAEEERREAAAKSLAAEKGTRMPSVTAEGNAYLVDDPEKDREWSVVLRMEIPVFDDGARRAGIREKAQQVRISELRLSEVRRRVEVEVKSSLAVFASAMAQRERLGEALDTGVKNLEAQTEDYRIGKANLLDVLAARAQVQRLRRRELGAEMGARLSLIRLHVAVGETPK